MAKPLRESKPPTPPDAREIETSIIRCVECHSEWDELEWIEAGLDEGWFLLSPPFPLTRFDGTLRDYQFGVCQACYRLLRARGW